MMNIVFDLRKTLLIGAMLFTASVACGPSSFAQDEVLGISLGNEEVEEAFFSREEEIMVAARQEVLEKARRHVVLRPSIASLLFLPGEHSLLQAAKSKFLTRVPTDAELAAVGESGEQVTSVREVSLGGILYAAEDRWVIWINSQRITPDAIPSEILDVSVFKEYIDLKWFDEQTNKIFPVRLRPNQRFNFDARMFLPAG